MLLFLWLLPLPCGIAAAEAASGAQLDRGRALYAQNCLACHQLMGQGVPGAFPPLAKSDYLMADKARSIRILCEGLSGEIRVNGRRYESAMPPVTLNDQDVADVLTFVRNSWGNEGEAVTADEVREVRAKTRFPTFERLAKESAFAPLPKAPDGFTIREVAQLPVQVTRMASDGQGRVLYLHAGAGDVWRLEPESGGLRQILRGRNYLEKRPGDLGDPINMAGMALDREGRLYIAANQQNNATPIVQNLVTIYRTTAVSDSGDPADPKPWFQTNYPGNFAYLHGVEHLAFGPDGYLYVGNGARTDANQSGGGKNYFQGGETEITSCLWRLDPRQEKPGLEIFARGIRNAYGFCWNDRGEMFATENGPDAHAPEELNHIERGRHYGFPYQFADWTNKAYAHTPDAPAGLQFTLPVANLGPDGGYDGKPVYSFDPHSSPGGIVFLGADFPQGWRGTFLLTRFGNFIRHPKDDVGFDLLQARLRRNAEGRYEANIHTVFARLGRPIDVHLAGKGRIYICEYSRPTNNQASFSLPGRILELAVKEEGAR